MITKIESTIGQTTTVAHVYRSSFTLVTNIVDDDERMVVTNKTTVSEDGRWEDAFCGGYTSENQPRESFETRKEVLEIIEKMCPWYAKRVSAEKQVTVSEERAREIEEAFRDF